MLQSMGSQRIGHDWTAEQQQSWRQEDTENHNLLKTETMETSARVTKLNCNLWKLSVEKFKT